MCHAMSTLAWCSAWSSKPLILLAAASSLGVASGVGQYLAAMMGLMIGLARSVLHADKRAIYSFECAAGPSPDPVSTRPAWLSWKGTLVTPPSLSTGGGSGFISTLHCRHCHLYTDTTHVGSGEHSILFGTLEQRLKCPAPSPAARTCSTCSR